ncbi:pantetheine-phosphate adenylyltransferase [Clostridium tarantellae]|uniref:Phosphopantetheine adenylyltransferase n=1 Tax=Clostridium tarantellae TaxID=39493 RepID=A0A6I1MJ56_9CLOT|nr:pantetheine-phosphate adenylyltransferase [Clostridium tarantellae]MPQ42438.1 pantetheine-phosphate adenylyltransferase [Clostridium tarantellae]
MRIAVYPGSFDPITNGHVNIIERSSKLFDKVIIAVLINIDKKGLFQIDERVEIIKKVVECYSNVEVKCFNGLLIDFMHREEANILIKGLRTVTDFEYEVPMALINNELDKNIETLFMLSDPTYSYISSSAIKQIAKFGGCVDKFIPKQILEIFNYKIKGY